MSMTMINFNKYLKTANKIKKTSDKQVIELHKAAKKQQHSSGVL